MKIAVRYQSRRGDTRGMADIIAKARGKGRAVGAIAAGIRSVLLDIKVQSELEQHFLKYKMYIKS